jgi:hypothetical protein
MYDKERVLNLIKWILSGYNENFMTQNFDNNIDTNELKDQYIKGIEVYMKMIRLGIMK